MWRFTYSFWFTATLAFLLAGAIAAWVVALLVTGSWWLIAGLPVLLVAQGLEVKLALRNRNVALARVAERATREMFPEEGAEDGRPAAG